MTEGRKTDLGIEIKSGSVVCDDLSFTLGDNVNIETMLGNCMFNASIIGVSRGYLTINYKNKRNRVVTENISIPSIKTIVRA